MLCGLPPARSSSATRWAFIRPLLAHLLIRLSCSQAPGAGRALHDTQILAYHRRRTCGAGIGSVRFDWPGTGDGRDDIDFSKGLEFWRNTLAEAARKARDLSGASRVIIIGQSLGAAIAAETAARIEGIAALALLAPVISGRFYTRELAVWSSMVDADLGLTDEQRIKNSVSIASLTMQPEVAADVKKINLLSLETKPAPQCLLLARTDRPNDAELATHLEGLGADVTVEAFTDYDKLISNPVISRLPLEVADRLVDWAAGLAGSQPAQNKPDERALGGTLTGDGFVETPVSFGSGNRLSGVLCAPVGERRGRTVLFLSAAYDRRVGWGARPSIWRASLRGKG